jgi:hypothetical protein
MLGKKKCEFVFGEKIAEVPQNCLLNKREPSSNKIMWKHYALLRLKPSIKLVHEIML